MASEGKAQILCVDDEPQVLAGLSVNLRRRHYDVHTATSGAEALALIGGGPSYTAIISDMMMPGMTGAAFLSQARAIAPDAVRMLLTGQTDVDSAIAAVNDGQIFRFLTKPCHPSTLLLAVEGACEQHRLITAERVLLEETLQGSVHVLVDVLALTSPIAFGRASRIKQYVAELAERLEMRERWQVEMAAMLSQLGSIVLPAEVLERVHVGAPLSELERAMVARVPAATTQLLGNIPRLDVVRDILAAYYRPYSAKSSPAASPGEAIVRRGSELLRVAVDFDLLEAQGCDKASALDVLRGRAGCYDPEAVHTLGALLAGRGEDKEIREVTAARLSVGMVLAADVKTEGGALLATRGYEVTAGFIERIRNSRDAAKRTFLIVQWPLDRAASA